MANAIDAAAQSVSRLFFGRGNAAGDVPATAESVTPAGGPIDPGKSAADAGGALFDMLRSASENQRAAGPGNSGTIAAWRDSLKDLTQAEARELLRIQIAKRHFVNIEIIIKYAPIKPCRDADRLWEAAISDGREDIPYLLGVLCRNRILPSSAGFRKLSADASSKNNAVVVEQLARYQNVCVPVSQQNSMTDGFDAPPSAPDNAEGSSESVSRAEYKSKLVRMHDRQRHGLIIDSVKRGNYRAVEVILEAMAELGYRFFRTDSTDELWKAAAENNHDSILGLFYAKNILPTDDTLSALATAAASEHNVSRITMLERYMEPENNNDYNARLMSYIREHGSFGDVIYEFEAMEASEQIRRYECIFRNAAFIACSQGHIDILIKLSQQGWFWSESDSLVGAANGNRVGHSYQGGPLIANVNVKVLKFLLEHGVDAAVVSWNELGQENVDKLLPFVDLTSLPRLPADIRAKVERLYAPLRASLQRARDRLDRPPTQELGTSNPTREQLIENLLSGGPRFARDYWEEGVPLFLPGQGDKLGPVPAAFNPAPLHTPAALDEDYEDYDGLGRLNA